jgi:23S rRNA pseudouridine2605 synthase
MRIAKYLAACGVASRRASEKLIIEGLVEVDGVVVSNLATQIDDGQKVRVEGKVVQRFAERKIWLFHKPKGMLTTRHDPQGRQTIYDILPKDMANVITIGRLDMNTEGLLVLTNDGDFARHMELPSSHVPRHYRVRISGSLTQHMIRQIESGLTIEEQDGEKMHYKPCAVHVDRTRDGRNQWLTMVLHEGKNREIRKIFEYFDLQVSRLIRVQYGDFKLGEIAVGGVVEAYIAKPL